MNRKVWTWVSVRIPDYLHSTLEREAATLGVSRSDVIRLRLLSGCIPTFNRGAVQFPQAIGPEAHV
jgi:hypothetical protein